MWLIFILCIIVGIIDAIQKMNDARIGIGAVKPSKNLFTFIFIDRY